ncbi:MAG: choice-of-anchor R domain-containing protein, partial [Actinomycetes bacterium]
MTARRQKRILRIAFLTVLAAFIGAAVIPFVFTTQANATSTTLYSQLNNGAWRSVQGTNWLAQSFSSSSAATVVTDVSIVFRNATENNGSSSGSSTYTLSIWSSSSGAPGTQLKSVATSVQPGAWSEGTQNYTLSSPLTLSPSTQYFVVMSGSGTMGWKCNAAAPTTNVSPTPTFTSLASSNSGGAWSAVSGTCAGLNFGMAVTGALPSTPTLSNFSNVSGTVGAPAQTIVAPTSTAPGTFTYSSATPAVASVSGDQLSFVSVGTAVITANFTPTDTVNYTTASTTMTVTVSQGTPTLGTFSNVSATYGDSAATITAPTSSTPGTFSYASSNTAVATVSG